ncbi:MAG: hypothetical protein HQL80_05490 [Magnetococcales bacterium]|nr:hypothetical protein [Magnetococcales bacterium]
MGTLPLTRISWFPSKSVLGLAVLLAMPTAAAAFSLGDIQVRTPFGEPFQAKIPLLLYPDEQAKGAEAALADADAYQLLKLPRDLVVSQIKVQLQGKGANRSIILQSDTPLRTPFFNVLLKTTVGAGSHYRNYPVFFETAPGRVGNRGRRPTARLITQPGSTPYPTTNHTIENGAVDRWCRSAQLRSRTGWGEFLRYCQKAATPRGLSPANAGRALVTQ